LCAAIDAAAPVGISNLTPGADSLLIEFDPLATNGDELGAMLQRLLNTTESATGPRRRLRRVPIVYDGPDLADVAARVGLAPAVVATKHQSVEYTVRFIGFAPGFPYLGDLPAELALPRRTTPRERVPAGSVAIAERQTGVYPRASPGGWHLIGRTPIELFDPRRDPPAYFAPGDRVRLFAITAAEWERYVGPPADWKP
jgi:KipI family sensor histidine kinase inhibitor